MIIVDREKLHWLVMASLHLQAWDPEDTVEEIKQKLLDAGIDLAVPSFAEPNGSAAKLMRILRADGWEAGYDEVYDLDTYPLKAVKDGVTHRATETMFSGGLEVAICRLFLVIRGIQVRLQKTTRIERELPGNQREIVNQLALAIYRTHGHNPIRQIKRNPMYFFDSKHPTEEACLAIAEQIFEDFLWGDRPSYEDDYSLDDEL